MKRTAALQIKLFSACLIAICTPAFTQSQFEVLENRFQSHIDHFRSKPSTLNQEEVRRLIEDIQSYSSAQNLTAIEKFTLPYYQGYLYYISGQHNQDGPTLDLAANRFGAAVRAYAPEVRLPEKRAFATYMQAWCSLRKYFASSDPDNLQPLQAASQPLQRLLGDASAGFLKDDIHFLNGLFQYLIAKHRFEKLEFDRVTLDGAIASLALVSERDSDLYKLSKLYLAAAYLISAKDSALHQLKPGTGVDVKPDSAAAHAAKAKRIFSTLADFGSMASFDYYLSSIYEPVIKGFDLDSGKFLFDQSQLGFSGAETKHRNLLAAYSHFLNYLSSGGPSGNVTVAVDGAESRLWRDLTDYLTYLSEGGDQAVNPSSLFNQISVDDWRRDYLAALHTVYRQESRVLAGSLNHFEVDTLYLMPIHRKRARFLQGLVRLQNDLQADILSFESVKAVSQSNSGAIASSYGSVFGAMNDRTKKDLFTFANYLLTLADKNRNLYAPAYLTYQFLNRLGYMHEKTTLLKAYCEYRWQGKSEQDNQDALTLLSEENIGSFSDNHRAEARYYRAMFYRKIDGPQYSSRVVDEMEKIKENHPYAGYGLGYERYRTVDVDLMNKVYTQVCGQDDSLIELCEACNDIAGYDPQRVSPSPAIHIGDPDVRFESLKILRQEFVRSEKRFLVNYWQVFSSPPQIAAPDTNKQLACDIPGPREYYLGNRIKVNLSLGKPDTLKRITISSAAEGCQMLSTTAATQSLDVLALRSYQIVVAAEGHYPTRLSIRFQNNEEVVTVAYDPALAPLGSLAIVDSSEIRVDSVDDFYIASRDHSNSMRLYKKSGQAISNGQASYSAIAVIGDRHYLLDRLSNQVWQMDKDGRLDKIDDFDESLLHRPSDLTGFNGYLVIANSGNNSTISYNLQNRTTKSLSLADAGRIESVVAIGGKLYVTDWLANTLWVGDLSGFSRLASSLEAARAGMVAPTHAQIFKDRYFVVSDLVESKLFLFDATGAYLDVLEMNPNMGGIHEVAYTDVGRPGFRIYANGSGKQPLTKKSGYNFDLRCGDDFTALGGPSDEKSRFCLLPLD